MAGTQTSSMVSVLICNKLVTDLIKIFEKSYSIFAEIARIPPPTPILKSPDYGMQKTVVPLAIPLLITQ